MGVAHGVKRHWVTLSKRLALLTTIWIGSSGVLASEALFLDVGMPSQAALPAHVQQAQSVRINRRALQSPSMMLDLFGEQVRAVRDRIDRHRAGQLVWTGHLEGNVANTVIITLRGNTVSGVIYRDAAVYRLGVARDGGSRLYSLDVASLPPDDAQMPLDGGGANQGEMPSSAGDGSVVQDLLVVYTQGACNYVGSCANLEADIVTAVAELNAAYTASQVDITMNLVGMALTNYSGTNASTTLSDLRGTSDGNMDEVHPLRDQLGADVVSLIYDGAGCGIGYLSSSASYAFNVTDVPCLVGNRTMAHEIGHNQGAHHDRVTVGGGTTGAYNYGYRRCNDGSVDDFGSPYFRTIMSYSCTSASRVGRFSHPYVNYSGVPSGVDPALDANKGAWNAQTLNDSAAYVAGFRPSAAVTPPAAPSGLTAQVAGPDAIDLAWTDNAGDESAFSIERSLDNANWSIIATVAANTTAHGDDGLQPETTYYYRVAAENGAGSSAYSNVAMESTQPLPSNIDDVATADIFGTGTVTGSYVSTHVADGAYQNITEQHAGGPKHRRKQSYVHGWQFDVFGGAGGVMVTVHAGVSGSEGANFYYSTDDGISWTLMFTVDGPNSMHTFALPGGTAGPLRIEVRDATQTNGESVDSVSVDAIVVTSYTQPGSPPAIPSMVDASAISASQVSVDFVDNATDEFGFEIWRAMADPAGDCNAGNLIDTVGAYAQTGSVNYMDNAAVPNQSQWYWVKAFNGAGDAGCSATAQATTPVAPDVDLNASGYKVKGRQHVDLTWSGAASDSVDIYRDASLLDTVPNTPSAYTDVIGAKGGGSYSYQLCEQGTATCSPIRQVTF